VKKGDEIIGNKVRVKVVKNKVAPPFKQAEFEILFGQGIDRLGYLIDMGVNEGIIEKSGAFFSYKDERIGQGRDNVKQYLADNQQVAEEIENAIRQKYFAAPAAAEAVPEKKKKPKDTDIGNND
jgi:recombination protein RecA